ncbi:ABC transporter ATP-binding protein [Nakamurella lactea]|uniref:ABC transporter ATP-binding protein n=1 Tax=Nakamurella lactea TaxID=459515 RepID=UPI00048B69B7|nr:ABC transporter ATP-binding protein [Nakamurella lactea]
MSAVLQVSGLRTAVATADGPLEIVRGVDLAVEAGETLAVVGESGSGKSFTALSIAGLLPAGATVTAGSIRIDGQETADLPEPARRRIRGAQIGMVYQDPMTSLNPMMRIGPQVREALTVHGWTAAEATRRTMEVLDEVGLPTPGAMARLYPHQLSGGMRQRVLIAIALAPRPKVLIADEPTTALDVTIQQQILQLVGGLRDEYGLAVVWITHDLGVVARIARQVSVMYAGRIVEQASVLDLFGAPTHPYSAALVASVPPMRGTDRGDLPQIGGSAVPLADLPIGCPFRERCPQSIEICAEREPDLLPRNGSHAACWVEPGDWT